MGPRRLIQKRKLRHAQIQEWWGQDLNSAPAGLEEDMPHPAACRGGEEDYR